jgi:hypothetical protein
MEVVWGGEANVTYFKAGINKEEFYHFHNELRKNPTQCSEYCRTLPSIFDYIEQAVQHIIYSRLYSTLYTAGYTAHYIQQAIQHIIYSRLYSTLYTAGYTAHYIQQAIQHISHSSTNFQKTMSFEVKLFVTLRSVRHATHLTHFIQFCDRASFVHWKSAAFLMNQAHW